MLRNNAQVVKVALVVMCTAAAACLGVWHASSPAAAQDRPVAQTSSAQDGDSNDGDANDGDANDGDANDGDTNDGDVTMTLLHNNDGESKLLPDADGGFPGIARFAQAFTDLSTASDADILLRVTSGDNFLASKELAVSLALPAGQPLYDAVGLSGLYDVMGLGNHDFDFGPDVAARFIADMSPEIPFVAANLNFDGEPALAALVQDGRLAASTIVTDPQSGLQVGVIGAVTPRLANISSPGDVIVDTDIAAAVNTEVEALEADGVNRIVLVSHLQGLSEDRDLLPQLRGVDIVVAGGGDELLKNDGDTCMSDDEAEGEYPLFVSDADGVDTPVVTAPGGYRCIGHLEVTFDADGNVTAIEGESVGVDINGAAESYAVDEVEEPLIAALADLESTIVATSEVVLDGRKSSVRTGATNLGELMADALRSATDADIAVQNAGGIRNDSEIAASELSTADTFDIAPFPNFVVTVDVPRETLREMLEVGVGSLPEAAGTFPQISGFTLEVDPTAPGASPEADGSCDVAPGSRVRSVTLDDGTVIVADGEVVNGPPITMATIDFLARGGDCYPLGDLDVTRQDITYQQALASHLTETLDGSVEADQYREGGSRSTFATASTAESVAGTEDDAATGTEPDDTDDADSNAAATAPESLPNTGVDSWIYLVSAATVLIGGTMIAAESRRTSKISLLNRLFATGAWFPHRNQE